MGSLAIGSFIFLLIANFIATRGIKQNIALDYFLYYFEVFWIDKNSWQVYIYQACAKVPETCHKQFHYQLFSKVLSNAIKFN